MKHIGLFEGIGGFSLAARWMGWETIAWCEWNKFGQKVLRHHFPNAEGFWDITKSDFTKYANTVDIVTGGFPCQPYSAAGKRLGKEDERHLWPEMLRAIKEIQPGWVVGENVPGLLNWNDGVVLNEIKTDLESAGFEVFPPCVLPACGVNAPHRRDRVWIIAYSKSNFRKYEFRNEGYKSSEVQKKRSNEPFFITNPSNKGLQGSKINGSFTGIRSIGNEQPTGCVSPTWENFPTQPPLCNGNDGLPPELDGITFSKWREESIKAGGNAIVPKIALQIFKAIEQYENQK